ncbi:response regulator [Alteromonas sediminis]|uniref:Response regulator n=1 Tax=Alteromonas sediminis TaxID=2259342 RepID=A0A3N5Y9G5_9ALTE|nr:response regulator [Alteromonas sediminis]RPJ67899.1 response regulator [Alteromonas sediminis]
MSYRVLICDDSALARKMTKRSLPDNFADSVAQASNGEEAVSLLSQQQFDLLLLDLTMPILDGVGVLEQLKQKEIDIFTIVISGDIQPEMQSRVKQFGVVDFIPKPICAEKLTQTLKLYGFF